MNSQNPEGDNLNDVAIIGMACRFPMANTPSEFWKNLVDGRECISRYTDDELREAGVPSSLLQHPRYVKASGSIDGIEQFDAGFFDYSPREASMIDPQQRFFLEQAWKALEDANCNPETYRGLIGVYAGSGMNTYLFNNLQTHPEMLAESGGYHVMVASDKDFLATRVSYKMNLKGPSLTIQTACSTSLVAVHAACQALKSGECDVALAGGVSLRVPQKTGYLYEEGIVLSPDGHCRAFDEKAQGTVIGNGAGVVVLKLLSEALEDGDNIYAVIKGSAINNDGSLKAGYTAPGMESQASVIYEALSLAGVEPESIGYVEAHGTGTALGDPIEIAALTKAFKTGNVASGSCLIGSVKTNIGHLDAASGVAGLMKAALVVKNGIIPASLNFEKPNPKINFANTPFSVVTKTQSWPSNGAPRRVGVSSFGIGGTNVHLIVEEAPTTVARKPIEQPVPVVLSAKSEKALERRRIDLASFLETHPEISLHDVAFSLATGRKTMRHRVAFVARDRASLITTLADPQSRKTFVSSDDRKDQNIAFVFPGQGSQYLQMAREIYVSNRTFQETADKYFAFAEKLLGTDLKKIVYPESGDLETNNARLRETDKTQVLLFIIELSLAQLLLSWGVVPKTMLGHSVGEYAAACLAGVLSWEDALTLVCERGKLLSQLPQGSMLAVPLAETEVIPLLSAELSLAAVNGPQLCVISGPTESIGKLNETLLGRGVEGKILETSHAFHSSMLDPILPSFRQAVASLKLSAPKIRYLSTCTGKPILDSEAVDPDYWVKHLRQTVRFSEAGEQLLKMPETTIVEVGPGKVLSSMLRHHPSKSPKQAILNCLPHPEEKVNSSETLLEMMTSLWTVGGLSQWRSFYEEMDWGTASVSLPTYSFDGQICWIAPSNSASSNTHSPYFTPIFKKVPGEPHREQKKLASSCLVFGQKDAFCDNLIEVLRGLGTQVLVIDAATSTLDPEKPETLRDLFTEIARQQIAIDEILYLWGLDDTMPARRHFDNLISLASFANLDPAGRRINLSAFFQGLIDLSGSEQYDPDLFAISGLVQSIPARFSKVRFQLTDVGSGPFDFEKLATRALQDTMHSRREPLLALRNKTRWVQHFEHIPLETIEERGSRFVPGNTYLFVNVAEDFDQDIISGAQHKVSVRWLASSRVTLSFNGTVVFDASLSEPAGVQTILEKIRETGTELTGIVYHPIKKNADGSAFERTHFQENVLHFEKELRNLCVLVREAAPEFVAVMGGVTRLGLENSWLQGMVREIRKTEKAEWFYLDFEEAEVTRSPDLLLEGALTYGMPDQVSIASIPPGSVEDIQSTETVLSDVLTFGSRPVLGNSYIEPEGSTEQIVVRIWEQTLGVRPIGVTDNFFELGGNSLMIAQIIAKVRSECGTDAPLASVVYENPTPRHLAEYIEAISAGAQLTTVPDGTAFEEGEF